MARTTASGAATIELPICLLILFLVFFLPLLDLAVCGLRSNTIFSCARDASRVAARAVTFSSAKSLALSQVAVTANAALAGTSINTGQVVVNIVSIPTNGSGTVSRSLTPLTAPADTTNYVYQIEVIVPGTVQPLVTLTPVLFTSIAGISAPMTITASNREFAEHPSGLNQ